MTVFDQNMWIWIPLLIAPFIGSFISVLVTRLPVDEPVAFSRSKCRSCHTPLHGVDLIPVFSWLFLWGKCRFCKTDFGVGYLLLEIGAFAIAFWASVTLPPDILWIGCLLGWCLLALAIIDYRYFILPNPINFLVLGAGLLIFFLGDRASFLDHLMGAIAGYGLFFLISRLYAKIRDKEGLGQGDVKLFAAIGAWVTWMGLPSVLLLACGVAIIGILVKMVIGQKITNTERIPFGTCLCLAAWIVWLYGPLSISV